MYDFALLKLVEPARISPTVGIVCLASDPSQRFVGVNLTASGWGNMALDLDKKSPVLRKTTVVGMNQGS